MNEAEKLRKEAAELIVNIENLLRDWPTRSRVHRRKTVEEVLDDLQTSLPKSKSVVDLREIVQRLRKTINDNPLEQAPIQIELSSLIKEAEDRENGFQPLENAIREAVHTPNDSPSPIQRKQLQKIANGEDLPLRPSQLQALDTYLRSRGMRTIADLFEPPSIARSLAETGRVAFIFGSLPNREARRISLSRWDARGWQIVLNDFQATNLPIQLTFEDVIFRGKKAKVFEDPEQVGENEAWYHLVRPPLLRRDSVVVIGNSKTNHGCEVVMADMLGVKPFAAWPKNRLKERPYAFAWHKSDTRANDNASCFFLREQEIEKLDWLPESDRHWLADLISGKQTASKDCALVTDQRMYRIERSNPEKFRWKSYAVIAVRKYRRRIFACVQGATGPATMGACRMLSHFDPDLSRINESDPTAWCVVEVDVRDDGVGLSPEESFRADERRIEGQRIIFQSDPGILGKGG